MNVYKSTLYGNEEISFYSMKILTGTEENHVRITNTTHIETSHVHESHKMLLQSMTKRGGWRRAPDDAVVVDSMSELEHQSISAIVKKPFRCLVGSRGFLHDDFDIMPPDEDTQFSHYEYGFEATLQESKKTKNSGSFRKLKGGFPSNASWEEAPPPPESAVNIVSLEDPYFFPQRHVNSFEGIPPNTIMRSHSFADAIPPGKKNDPLDSESIRDVFKALREMERKLEAAGTEGKKVSRTKVMKALLSVVDQLDDAQHTSIIGAPIVYNNSFDSSAELYRMCGAGNSATDAHHAEEVALDRQRRNLEQMRELTITPSKERAESPWKGDKSFSKMNGNKLFAESKSTEDTEAEPEYISSSSKEEEENLFSRETGLIRKSKRGSKKKGSFADAVYNEDSTTIEDGTLEFEDTSYLAPPRGKSQKGSFAHAVSPSAARSVTRSSSFDMFNLDMRDPAVHDALADLLWIPSLNKTIDDSSTTKANVVSPSSESEDQLDDMRNNGSVLSYNGEDEYYDKPDISEATTEATTHSSYSSQQGQEQQRPARETSWWKRRTRASLKPSSKDTPIGPPEKSRPRSYIQTRVTVTQQDDLVPWYQKDDRRRWE
jgi:hypothetical protein